jgi:hypothetical protein
MCHIKGGFSANYHRINFCQTVIRLKKTPIILRTITQCVPFLRTLNSYITIYFYFILDLKCIGICVSEAQN